MGAGGTRLAFSIESEVSQPDVTPEVAEYEETRGLRRGTGVASSRVGSVASARFDRDGDSHLIIGDPFAHLTRRRSCHLPLNLS
jgi:hypothetical protein